MCVTYVNICCVEVKIYLEELCYESTGWVHLAQDKDLWWAVNESSNEPLDFMNTKLVRFEVLTVVLLEGSSLVGCCASSTEHCVTTQKI
jgi:hypothetical protein